MADTAAVLFVREDFDLQYDFRIIPDMSRRIEGSIRSVRLTDQNLRRRTTFIVFVNASTSQLVPCRDKNSSTRFLWSLARSDFNTRESVCLRTLFVREVVKTPFVFVLSILLTFPDLCPLNFSG